MSGKKKVLLVGWHPKITDYSKWPELDAEKLSAALLQEKDRLISQGYDAQWCYLLNEANDSDLLIKTLSEAEYDCVLIGAGVRLDPSAFIVFERLINIIHTTSPNSKISFNTTLSDIAESVKRWI